MPRKLLTFLAVVAALAVVAVMVVTLARIPVDLSSYKGLIESETSKALGRKVTVDGKVFVTTSLWPYFEMGGLQVASPPEFGVDNLLQMKRARVTIGLLPLLRREIHIRSLIVEGLSLNLVRTADGDINWSRAPPDDRGTEPGRIPDAPSSGERMTWVADELLLGEISVRFDDRSTGDVQTFLLTEARGTAPKGEPMTLDSRGVFREEPYAVSIEATSLADFLALTHTRLDLRVDIADTRLTFGGFTDRLGPNLRSELEVTLEGARMASLNRLLDVDLPPLEDYQFSARLVARPDQLELTGLNLRVKESALTGNALVDRTSVPPAITVDLASKKIQLRDFDTGDWSAEEEQPATDSEPAPSPASGQTRPIKPLSPEALRRFDAEVSIRVDEVLSGPDPFGSGELLASLRGGRISIDPLKLESREQSLFLQSSVKPDRQLSDASLRVLARNVDLGALTRLSRPESEIGGVLHLDIDVKTSAMQFHNLLARADGYFDIAGVPENLESGAVDLWAVNLLSTVVASAVKGDDVSHVNCLMSRWSLDNGRMEARQLAVDTSRIRICGKGEVDFAERKLDLVVKPKAKRAEFFSLATPLRIKGRFDDFGIGMKGGPLALGTTLVGFVISPITTPMQRMLREDLPREGGDICGLPIGPHQGRLKDLPGC